MVKRLSSVCVTCLLLSLALLLGVRSAGAACGDAEDKAAGDFRGRQADAQALNQRYDRVAVLMTHNAMSNAADGWLFPNQTHGVARQLKEGVRGLMLDVHAIDGQPYLVHGFSLLGKRPLVDGLREVRLFLDANPNAVLTIIIESHVDAKLLKPAFDASRLTPLLHVQEPGQPWPLQREMVQRGRRLVVFTDRGAGEWKGLHDVWRFCQETQFAVADVKMFSYDRNRGLAANSLFILNHFLTAPVASKQLAAKANSHRVLMPRVLECESKANHFPKFVVVDFYQIGCGSEAVTKINAGEARRKKD